MFMTMARRPRDFAASCLIFFVLIAGAAAINLKVPEFDAPAFPQITPAPADETLNLRLRDGLSPRATSYPCADVCLDSAVVGSTTCTLHDVACECEPGNSDLIYLAGYSCVIASCGSQIATSECYLSLFFSPRQCKDEFGWHGYLHILTWNEAFSTRHSKFARASVTERTPQTL